MRSLVARGSHCIDDYSMFAARRGEHDRWEAGGLILQDNFSRFVLDIVMKLHMGIEKQEVRNVLVLSK